MKRLVCLAAAIVLAVSIAGQMKETVNVNLVEVPVTDPGENEVQVQSGACGICSWDVNTAKLDLDAGECRVEFAFQPSPGQQVVIEAPPCR